MADRIMDVSGMRRWLLGDETTRWRSVAFGASRCRAICRGRAISAPPGDVVGISRAKPGRRMVPGLYPGARGVRGARAARGVRGVRETPGVPEVSVARGDRG